MKKLATIIGLLSLMLVVTSFTTANNIGGGNELPSDPKKPRVTIQTQLPSIGGGNELPSDPKKPRIVSQTLSIGGGNELPTSGGGK